MDKPIEASAATRASRTDDEGVPVLRLKYRQDQRLWQLIVIVTWPGLAVSGTLMWLFKLKMPLELYQWVLIAHGTAFVVVSVMFLLHFYLRTLHPRFEESLASMLDGKVSPSYAQDHYRKWYDGKTGPE